MIPPDWKALQPCSATQSVAEDLPRAYDDLLGRARVLRDTLAILLERLEAHPEKAARAATAAILQLELGAPR